MTIHQLTAREGTVHGVFDRALEPVLTVTSGDTVVFETLDASWGRRGHEMLGQPLPAIAHSPSREEAGHALTGPVYIEGAERGHVLEVEIGEVRPGSWGTTWATPRMHMPLFDLGVPEDTWLLWHIDADHGVARTQDEPKVEVELGPFMGVMGNAPESAGRHSTRPPRRVGGNIDCRDLGPGTTLWLPVEVDGALFSVGDGHARQGDGEVSNTAIECPMERVELTFRVRQDMHQLPGPEASTREGHVTLGFGLDLDEAAARALQAMLERLERTYGMSRGQSMALASVIVDLRVTQIVNETVGVHAVLPHDALRPWQ